MTRPYYLLCIDIQMNVSEFSFVTVHVYKSPTVGNTDEFRNSRRYIVQYTATDTAVVIE